MDLGCIFMFFISLGWISMDLGWIFHGFAGMDFPQIFMGLGWISTDLGWVRGGSMDFMDLGWTGMDFELIF